MSDEEIIEKLNKIVKEKETMYWFDEIKSALDLINRQRAEIEQLKFEIAKLLPKGCPYAIQVEVSNKLEAQIKAEAVKEFAARLKCGVPQETGVIRCSDVDNLVKEMVGE